MKRFGLVLVFAGLVWASAAWTRNSPVPENERTFEASRVGFQPIDTAGPLSRNDFVRLLLRRQGDFRIPLTVNFRVWRRADPPDLWETDLGRAIKLDLSQERTGLRAGLPNEVASGVVLNQPLLVRNRLAAGVDLQAIVEIGEARLVDRFRLGEGLNFFSLNIRPQGAGSQQMTVRFLAGEESVRPQREASASKIIDVVEWGTLKLITQDNGEAVHSRVSLFGSDGLAYAPEQGTLSKITWTAGEPFFYSRGEHEIRLPAGLATLKAVRGFEYTPVEQTVEIRPGETTNLTLTLERFSNLAAEGWYGGDSHIHANYNDHEFITPEDALTQALGEDLNVANLMVANSTGAQVHDSAYFEGRPHRLSQKNHLLRWIEEMRNGSIYGHMCLPGIDKLVHPLYTGFPGTPHPYDYPPNYFQAKGAQEAGGVASYAHPGYNFTDSPFTMSARELPVDLALGVVEAMDVLSNSNEAAALPYWYKLLNTGLRCSISGGSDSFTNRRHHWLPGGQRVYAYTGGDLDYSEWVESYRKGRSFASNGPILKFTVNDKLAGSTFELSKGDAVSVKAEVASLVSLDALEIVVNGEVVAAAEGPARELSLDTELTLDKGSWIAARARGPYDRLLVNDDNAFAHSSPVYCLVDGRKPRNPDDARFFISWIDQLIERVERSDRFETGAQRRETMELFQRAQDYYRGVL